jgi:hypothetical protein
MAFTAEEEADLKDLMSAYKRGKKINELGVSQAGIENYTIEVQDNSGESKKVNLMQAISTVNKRMAVRRWNETLSTPTGEAFGNIDFLRELPSLLALGCYLVTDDRKKKKLDPTNHYRYQDGSPAKLDGSEGQYMWCWNKHYYASWKDGNYTYEAVSLEPIEGHECYCVPAGGVSALGGGVLDRTNYILCSVVNDSAQYRGGANQSAWDGTYRSQLGMVATSITYRDFSTYARKRGEGWEANWYVAQAVTGYLFSVIFGSRNSQAAFSANKDANGLYQGGLGAGVTNMPNWDLWGYYPIIPTSAGIELGDSCGESAYNVLKEDGSVHYAAKIPVFFGLKHPYGHVWKVVRGILVDAGAEKTTAYVAPSLYAGMNDASVEGMIKAAELSRAEGWAKRISMNKLCGLTTEIGGSASSYYCDYFYTNAQSYQGLRVRLAGTSASYGTYAGAFCSDVYTAWSSTRTTVSSPLCFFEEDPLIS